MSDKRATTRDAFTSLLGTFLASCHPLSAAFANVPHDPDERRAFFNAKIDTFLDALTEELDTRCDACGKTVAACNAEKDAIQDHNERGGL